MAAFSIHSKRKRINMTEKRMEIGKVSLRVIPDTRGFQRRVRSEVRKATSGLAVKIDVTADTAEFASDVRRAKERVEKSVGAIELDVKVDEATSIAHGFKAFRREVKQSREQVAELQRRMKNYDWAISPKLNARDRQRVTREIEELVSKNLRLEAELEFEHDEMKVNKIKRDIEKHLDDINARVVPELNENGLITTRARLVMLARPRVVDIVPKVNKAAATKAAATLAALSGARVVSDYISDIWDVFKDIDKLTPKVASLALAIMNLGGYALTAASNLFALSMSLAQMFGASLALPGILGGLAVGLGATVAVLKDFNDRLPFVKERLSALQDQMSDRFWAKAEKPMRRMIDVLLPQFESGLRKTSKSLGGYFANLSNSARESLDGRIAPMFKNLNRSIEVSGEYTSDLTDLVALLGLTGSEYLPRLAKSVGELARRWRDWVEQARDSGRMTEIIEHGIFEIREFGRLLKATGRTLAGLGRAAERAGGSTLTDAADTMESVAKTVNGTRFQNNLVKVLDASHRAMENISKGSGKQFKSFMESLATVLEINLPRAGRTMGTALGGIFDALGSNPMMAAVGNFFIDVEKGVNGLVPSLPKVSEGLAAIVEIIGSLAEQLGPTIGKALEIVSEMAVRLKEPVQELISDIGPAMQDWLEALSPVAYAVADAFADILESTKSWRGDMFDAITDLLNALTPAAVALIEDFARAVEDISAVMGGGSPGDNGETGGFVGYIAVFIAAVASAAWVVGKLKKALDVGKNALKLFGIGGKDAGDKAKGASRKVNDLGEKSKKSGSKVGGLASKVKTLGKYLLGIPGLIGATVIGLGNLASEASGWLGDKLSDMFDLPDDPGGGFTTRLKRILGLEEYPEVRSEFMGSLRSVVEGAGVELEVGRGKLLGDVREMMRGVSTELANSKAGVDASARTAVSGIPGAFASPKTQANAQTHAVVDSVRNIIGGSKVPFWHAAREAVSGVPGAIGTAKAGARTQARQIVDDVAAWLRGGKDRNFWAGFDVGSAAKSGLSQGGAGAYWVGSDIAQGLINGMNSMRHIVGFAAWGLGAFALSQARAAVNSHSPSRKFMELGGDIGDGLAIGIDRSKSRVLRSVQNLAEEMQSTFSAVDMSVDPAPVSARVSTRLADSDLSDEGVTVNQLNYYAPEGSGSISSEEELFKASARARMVFR